MRHTRLILISLRSLLVMLAVGGLLCSTGNAEAHDLEVNSGYTAVLHIDPDDEPLAGQASTLNFLIGKTGASYNQNDYNLSVDISSAGKHLQHAVVQPRVFGDAGDGVVNYTFPRIAVYRIDLNGVLKSNASTRFHMGYTIRITNAMKGYSPPSEGLDPTVLLLGVSVAAVVLFVGFMAWPYAKRR